MVRGEPGGGVIGRDPELEVVRASLARASRRDGHLLLIEGEAGIGKSKLAEATAELASANGFSVWEGRSEELGWDRPFGSLIAALRVDADPDDPARAAVAALLAAPMPGSTSMLEVTIPELRFRIAEAFAELVATIAERQPSMLVLEDLHAADVSTLVALRAVLRRCRRRPVLVVATARPAATHASSGHVAALLEQHAVEVTLGRLPPEAVRELARSLLGAEPGSRLWQLIEGAGGNPLLVSELIRGLRHDGTIELGGDRAEVAGDTLPESFNHHVLRQLDGLDPDVRGLLRLAAVLGSRFMVDDLALASGRRATELMGMVDEALRAGVLSATGSELAFRHELVRAAIYDQVPQAVRVGVHRDVARALAASGDSTLRIASHFALGAEPGDAEAVTWLQRAARLVMDSAPETALELVDRAIELVESGHDRVQLLTTRLEALALSGDLEQAEELGAQLVHLAADAPARHELRRRVAGVLVLRNRAADAAALLDETGRLATGQGRAETLAEAALAHLVAGDPGAARQVAERARRAARDATSAAAEALALCVLSRLASFALDLERSLALADEAIEVADRDSSGQAHRHQPLLFRGLTLHDLDRLDDTLALVSTARAVSRRLGGTFAEPLYCGLAAFAHLRAGRLQQATSEARAGIATSQNLGSSVAAAWCQAVLALAALHQDDVDSASRAVGAAERAMTDGPPLLGFDLVVLAHALLDEELGDQGAALDRLRGAWDLFADLAVPTLGAVVGPDLARLAVAAERPDLVRPVVEALESGGDRVQLPSWRGAALEARGLLEADVETLLAAADAYRASPRNLALARATEHASRACAAAGRTDEATRLSREAIDRYDAAGARRDRARVAALLRATGEPPQPVSGARGGLRLSAGERDVVRLAAQGLSNQEIADRRFVSRRTVETHLRRAFAKIGVKSRVELVLWWQRSGDEPDSP